MESDGRAASNPSAMLAGLLGKRDKLLEELRSIEKQVYDLETSYLQESNQCGNVLKGFEGFLSASKSTINLKRSRKFQPEDRIFSLSSATSPAMARAASAFSLLIAASTTSVTQKLARHRDILHEYSQEFRRTKLNLSSLKEHAELLNSVRDDITESKASGSMSPRVHLLRERASIHGSINQIDEVINQAQATRLVLGTQRAFFGDVQGKVKQLGDKFPIIRNLLGAIRRKRSKDTLILAAVIAACTLFLIIYWLSK